MTELLPQYSPAVFIRYGQNESIHEETCGIEDRWEDLVFPIYSIIKPIIACSILMLKDQGKLDLQMKLKEFSFCPDVEWVKDLKLIHVLTHRSGLGDYGYLKEYHQLLRTSSQKGVSEKELINMVISQGPHFKEDQDFLYSNIGYLFLRKVVEEISQVSIDQFIEGRIIKATLLESLEDMKKISFPTRISKSLNGDVKELYHPSFVSHGLLASTVGDVKDFLQKLFSGELLSKESMKLLREPIPVPHVSTYTSPHYGMGVMGDPATSFGMMLGHDGGGPGFSLGAYYIDKGEDKEIDIFVSGVENLSPHEIISKSNIFRKTLPDLCVDLDRVNLGKEILDGRGNPISWDKLPRLMRQALDSGAYISPIFSSGILEGYLFYRVQEREAFVLSIQVRNPGNNLKTLKKLMVLSLKELNERDIDCIKSVVDKNNLKSLSLHHSLGFQITSERETAFCFEIKKDDLLKRLGRFSPITSV